MSSDRRKLLAEADRAARRGKFDKAVEIYRQLVAGSSRDLGLKQKLADSLARGGDEREAAELFVTLADGYWELGHRARAIATVKRAIRSRPKSPNLLFKLGTWTLEQGHPADAKQPLMAAVGLKLEADVAAEMKDSYDLLARMRPKDPDVHRALVRIAELVDSPGELARAKAGLASALVLAGDPAEACENLIAALEADPAGLSALSRLSQLIALADEVEPDDIVARARESGPGSSIGVAILLAAWHGRHARTDEGAALLSSSLDEPEGWTPSALGYAAETMAELDQPEAVTELAERVLEVADQDEALRQRVARVLHRLVAIFPSQEKATVLLNSLSSAPPVEDEPRAGFQPPIPADGPQDGSRPLPAVVQQRVVEAQALFTHGLHDEASAIVQQIDARWQNHPGVVGIRNDIVSQTSTRTHPVAAPTEPGTRRPVPPAAPDGEDLLVLTEHDETGTLEAEDTSLGAPSEDAPEMEVFAVNELEDDETRYQMAVGLLQMGLEGQAIPLLEACLKNPDRRAESALELVRVHARLGALDKALVVGQDALAAPDLTLGLRSELLAEVAAVALHEGNAALAGDAVSELDAIAPDHPSIGGLRSRIMASEN